MFCTSFFGTTTLFSDAVFLFLFLFLGLHWKHGEEIRAGDHHLQKQGEKWTQVTFKPDLAKFNMTHLEDDVVSLMRKRVIDMAGTLGETVNVELNGKMVPVKNFSNYVNWYIKSASRERG